MNNTDALEALTNQRVAFTFGGKSYTARRSTLNDLGLLARYGREHSVDGVQQNELESSLYILTELMKPDFSMTPEELGATIDLTQYEDVTKPIQELAAILNQLGLRLPQLPTVQKNP